jgi:hypothetical protein
MVPKGGLDATKNKKILPLSGIEPRPYKPSRMAIPTLSVGSRAGEKFPCNRV